MYGPLPETPTGYHWIVTAVDHRTRYSETALLRTGCAEEVSSFFLHRIVLRHGAPRVLLTDWGRTFPSNIVAELLHATRTVHKSTTGYHPQTIGLTERFHRTLSDMLSIYIAPDHSNWDHKLPFVQSLTIRPPNAPPVIPHSFSYTAAHRPRHQTPVSLPPLYHVLLQALNSSSLA